MLLLWFYGVSHLSPLPQHEFGPTVLFRANVCLPLWCFAESNPVFCTFCMPRPLSNQTRTKVMEMALCSPLISIKNYISQHYYFLNVCRLLSFAFLWFLKLHHLFLPCNFDCILLNIYTLLKWLFYFLWPLLFQKLEGKNKWLPNYTFIYFYFSHSFNGQNCCNI